MNIEDSSNDDVPMPPVPSAVATAVELELASLFAYEVSNIQTDLLDLIGYTHGSHISSQQWYFSCPGMCSE